MISEFTLGGIKWTVKEDESRLKDLNLFGLCEFPKSLVSIYANGIEGKLVEQTLYHEVVHAILESIGEGELSTNDKFVQNFALLLHQFETTKK
jgi:hypothetical protein